jgi:hypothetical protein
MITWPDGTTTTEPSTDFTATVSKTLEVEPGSRLVGVTSLDLDGVESRSVIIGSLSVVQTAVERYLGDSE